MDVDSVSRGSVLVRVCVCVPVSKKLPGNHQLNCYVFIEKEETKKKKKN